MPASPIADTPAVPRPQADGASTGVGGAETSRAADGDYISDLQENLEIPSTGGKAGSKGDTDEEKNFTTDLEENLTVPTDTPKDVGKEKGKDYITDLEEHLTVPSGNTPARDNGKNYTTDLEQHLTIGGRSHSTSAGSDVQSDTSERLRDTLRTLYLPPDSTYGTQRQITRKDSTSVIFRAMPSDYPAVKRLNPLHKKRILVTGGAGFVGSHLVDRLMLQGHSVICVDNYFTGSKNNIAHWIGHPNFECIRHDVVDPIMLEVDQVYHLACPASPVHYQSNPVKTLKTGFFGTYNMLGLAKRVKARFLLASTSEVYGSPEEHPQRETYWGHVNPIGPRACYDEGKRVAEALAYSYMRQDKVDVRVARIFNSFGPRMNWNDGRVVSNFILQALRGEEMTIYGDGEATRSFQFVHDLVTGLVKLMESDITEPVNLGNPKEVTIKEFAETISRLVNESGGSVTGEKTGATAKIKYLPSVEDDPPRRKPDIERAKEKLGWEPTWDVEEGLKETIDYFRRVMEEH